ncbi:hypothetical protein M432DRAFT_638081 [Thermoascus aurantiacus ATCC 26904]
MLERAARERERRAGGYIGGTCAAGAASARREVPARSLPAAAQTPRSALRELQESRLKPPAPTPSLLAAVPAPPVSSPSSLAGWTGDAAALLLSAAVSSVDLLRPDLRHPVDDCSMLSAAVPLMAMSLDL